MSGGKVVWWAVLGCLVLAATPLLAFGTVAVREDTVAVVERAGRYSRTLSAGRSFLIPLVDRVVKRLNLGQLVVSFPPQPAITADELEVNVDAVVHFRVTDPRAATYGNSDYLQALELLAVATLRNIVGGMDRDVALSSSEEIEAALLEVLEENTGGWGIGVDHVEVGAE